MPKRIAFATYEKLPELTPDDQLAVAALGARGVEALPAVWDDDTVDWSAFDGVVIRSTWDYHLKAPRFAAWLDELDAHSVPLWNPADIVRWNMDKFYLGDLQELGIAVTPSVWLPRGAHAHLTELLETKGWDEAVVKPTVSASAHRTQRVSLAAADGAQAELEDMLKTSGVVVQPFLDAVQTQGEWSLMYFDKEFSHGVLKRPQDGDFRVQALFGGSEEALRPPEVLIEQAAKILDHVNDPVVYARVDGIEQDGQFVLMELELIEPVLFLGHGQGAPERFAEVLKELL